MVSKTGSRLPKSQFVISDTELANEVSNALIGELGGSHRATKTLMAWTHVSERTARSWLNGQSCPSAANLLTLSGHCDSVLKAALQLARYENVSLVIDLKTVERTLEVSLSSVRELISKGR